MTSQLRHMARHEIVTAALLFTVGDGDDSNRPLPGMCSIKVVVPNFRTKSSMFVFSKSCGEILLSLFKKKILFIPTGSAVMIKIFSLELSIYLILRSNSVK